MVLCSHPVVFPSFSLSLSFFPLMKHKHGHSPQCQLPAAAFITINYYSLYPEMPQRLHYSTFRLRHKLNKLEPVWEHDGKWGEQRNAEDMYQTLKSYYHITSHSVSRITDNSGTMFLPKITDLTFSMLHEHKIWSFHIWILFNIRIWWSM